MTTIIGTAALVTGLLMLLGGLINSNNTQSEKAGLILGVILGALIVNGIWLIALGV